MLIWVPILWMATGFCLFAGIHFLFAGHSQQNARLFPVFGLLCILLAVYLGVSAVLQTPAANAPWVALERLHIAVACLVYPTAVWFLSLYSRLRKWRAWVFGSAVVFGVFLVLNLTGEHGLLLADLKLAPPLELPWGEQVNQVIGTSTALAPAYYLATLAMFGWAFWRCWALWKQSDTRRSMPLTIYLVLQVIATVHAEYVTIHSLPALDWGGMPFLMLVLLLSRALTLELRDYDSALTASNTALSEENVRRARAETRLRHMAYNDLPSELPNRHALMDRLHAELAANPPRQGALVVIDPERFGIINYALGHRAGDLLIREIGKRLSQMVEREEFVARLNGDEFAVVLMTSVVDPDAALAQLMERADSLRRQLAEPSRVGTHALSVCVRMGLAMFHGAGANSDALLQQAYAALHVTKDAGHHELAAFTDSMQTDAERKLRLETDLRIAIECKQLRLVYQPQVDRDGCLVGAEALLRWEHPAYGAIDPLELVQMAQDSGQMQAMGRFVLDTAFATLATLPVHDRFRVAVNISPWQLFFPDFIATVQTAIREAAVDPGRITLEITETAFIHDIADATAKIRALDAMGICVSIDDFGTGYASIASLKAFPVRELKIDQTFIRDMSTTQPDRFVAAMIAMGRALNLHVVAEGVEHDAQRDSLIGMGCDVLQGYLISKPITAAELAFWSCDGASLYSSEPKPGYA